MPSTAKFDWSYITQTGQIPSGMSLFQDSMPLEVVDKKVLSESVNGRNSRVMRLTGVFQRADEQNQNGRVYPYEVLKTAVDDLQEAIEHRRVLGEFDHPCLTSDDWRVLTTNGWKDFKDVKIGDIVYSRVDGKIVESKVKAIVNEPFDGKVYHFKGRHIDAEFTAPHKIILDTRNDGQYARRQIEAIADQIYNNRKEYNKTIIPRTAEWVGEDPEAIIIPGVPVSEHSSPNDPLYERYMAETDDLQIDTKNFVSFLGLYLAEGSIRDNQVLIYQTKDDYKAQIRELLNDLIPGKEWIEDDKGFHVFDRRLAQYLKPLGNKYSKYIPCAIKELDSKYLEELVYWFQLGDGRQKHGRSNVFSVSEQLIRDLHECWVKAGHCCYYAQIMTEYDYEFAGRTIKAENKQPLHQLTLSYTDGIHLDDRFLKIEEKQHNGRIYCLTTEHGNFYMEHKGCSFWTGNSDAKIHLERVSHLITKLWMDGKIVYGELEVMNDDRCPYGSQLACLIERDVQVGISSRGIGDMEMIRVEDGDAYRVSDGFSFVTFDTVAEPSVKGTQLMVMESRERDIRRIAEHSLVNEVRNLLLG